CGHMHEDLASSVRRIAAFSGIPVDDELLRLVVRQASLAFMLAHKDKFDDRLMREHSERVGHLPAGSDSAKVRRGEVGGHRRELPPEIGAGLDRAWKEEIGARLGFADYASLAAALGREARG